MPDYLVVFLDAEESAIFQESFVGVDSIWDLFLQLSRFRHRRDLKDTAGASIIEVHGGE